MSAGERVALGLWSDEPSAVDLLAFAAVADTVVDAVLDDALDPVALGVSGAWGSGKTTVLRLVESALRTPAEDELVVLAIPTDPWRYDPTAGAKESLISAVLDALEAEIIRKRGPAADAVGLIRRLARRVDWSKALKVAAKASLAFQLPSVDELTDLVRIDADGDDGKTGTAWPRGVPRRVHDADGVGRSGARATCGRPGGRSRPLPSRHCGRDARDHSSVPGRSDDGVRDRGR
ncbi:MAG: KAP family NTPase [Acidimicrobiia bacterium]|nr:KAP family NTPase [Acidimicrobiia bacterium]